MTEPASWFRRYGGWLLGGLLAVGAVVLAVAVAMSGRKGGEAVLRSAVELDLVRAQVAAERQTHADEIARQLQPIADARTRLAEIDTIEDDRDRRAALLEFRRGQP